MNKTLTLQIAAGIASVLLVANAQSHPFTNNVQHACNHEGTGPITTKQVAVVIPTGATVQKINTTLACPMKISNL